MNEDMERRIDQLQAAADNAAGHVRNLYITFLLFGLYLVVAVAATTHEQLLRSEPVKLPIVNVELPLFGFYWVAPALYVLLHFNLLIQFSLLASKLHRLDQFIERHVKVASERAARRDLLGLFAFSHMLIGRHHRASLRFFLRSMIFISVILMPAIVLLFTQFRFLPYHSVATTWAHRSFVLIDLILILLLWLKIRYPHDDVRKQPFRWLLHRVRALFGMILVAAGSFSMTVPGERLGNWFEKSIGMEDYGKLFRLSVEETSLVTAWPTKEQIVDFGKDIAWRNFGGAISLHGRDLSYASFRSSTLTRADLSDTDLSKANLNEAILSGANLSEAKLNEADFSGASLSRSNLRGADLSGAKLNEADLSRANLSNANLRGANLGNTVLSGTELALADLREAYLFSADLNGANLSRAELWRANLREANLSNADLSHARLHSADLSGANLKGADLRGAEFSYTDFSEANLSHADFGEAYLHETDLREAKLFCGTTMPDGIECNRDCPDPLTDDQSCP